MPLFLKLRENLADGRNVAAVENVDAELRLEAHGKLGEVEGVEADVLAQARFGRESRELGLRLAAPYSVYYRQKFVHKTARIKTDIAAVVKKSAKLFARKFPARAGKRGAGFYFARISKSAVSGVGKSGKFFWLHSAGKGQ